MGQSLARILVHVTFSTKGRRPVLTDDRRDELHRYAIGILVRLKSPVIEINSVEDHIHVLFNLHRTVSLSDAVLELKRGTSRWLNEKHFPDIPFEWQRGYGAFSVSQSQEEIVCAYINKQREHHRQTTYQEEFRKLLQFHRLTFDEAYVWD